MRLHCQFIKQSESIFIHIFHYSITYTNFLVWILLDHLVKDTSFWTTSSINCTHQIFSTGLYASFIFTGLATKIILPHFSILQVGRIVGRSKSYPKKSYKNKKPTATTFFIKNFNIKQLAYINFFYISNLFCLKFYL